LLGGALLSFGSWRTIFWAIAALGAVVFLAVTFGIPETLERGQRPATGPGTGSTGERVAALLRNRAFLAHTAISCLSTAGFFVYIGGSSFVLRAVYHIDAIRYAHVFTVNAAAMVAGCLAFRCLVSRLGPSSLRLAGLTMAAVCTLGLVQVAVAGWHSDDHGSLTLVWILLSGVTAGMGLIIPASTTLAQQAGHYARGSAVALQGGGSFLVGAAVTPLTGFINPHSLLPMALLMAAFMTAALITAVAYRRAKC
jgi:DHA1 family bicyclomycin/chloramphenicol resistance-like MFS transporter